MFTKCILCAQNMEKNLIQSSQQYYLVGSSTFYRQGHQGVKRARDLPEFILLFNVCKRAISSPSPLVGRESLLPAEEVSYHFLKRPMHKILYPVSEVSFFTSIPHKPIYGLRTI